MNDFTVQMAHVEERKVGGNFEALPQLPDIPRGRYTDESFYNCEIKHVFGKTWHQVAHISEFNKEGSYRVVDMPLAPVFIVRQKNGELLAFLNSCRHRGSKVVRDEAGCASRFTCPYHAWTYDLKGSLVGLPLRSSFPGLIKEERSLESVRCELWGGFVFINMDRNAPPLLEYLSPLVRRYSALTAAPLRVISKQSWDLNCNWKILAEAFWETYHVNTVHARTAAPTLVAYETSFELYKNSASIYMPFAPQDQAPQDFQGLPDRASTLVALSGTEGEKFKETTLFATFFPATTIGFTPLGFPIIISWPLAVNRSRLEIVWYGMDWGDGEKPKEWDRVVSDFTAVINEDLVNLESIQRSVEADKGKGVPFSGQECLLYQLHSDVDKCIGVDNVPEHLRVPEPNRLTGYLIP